MFPGAVIAALVVGLLIGRQTSSTTAPVTAQVDSAAAEPTQWTCSMHPNIIQPDQGDCPICGMDLIPLMKATDDDLGPRAMSMTKSSMALADIQTTVVARAFPTVEVNLVGRLEYDQTKIRSLTARFPARIDQLYVNYQGAPVKQREHLAKIFSPELSTAQHELLLAYHADPESSLTQASREKLRLWDLLPEQIDAIIEAGQASDRFELIAPIGGIVVEKLVNEGDYVQTGQPLMTIVDLSRLWLFLDAYESDLQWLRFGQDVIFTVEAFPGESFSGRIAFIEPELNRRSRTVRIRVNVDNSDGRLKAGMFARGIVQAKVAEGGKVYAPELAGKWISPMHPEIVKDGPGSCDVCGMDLVTAESLGYVEVPEGEIPLVVPGSAVLRTGKRAVVYVQKTDAEAPTFEGREITLGPRAGDVYIVKSGLQENDRVVTNGAFKIDSALQIQAKPSMMSPEGGNGESGHAGHGGEPAASGTATVSSDSLQIDTATALLILQDYFILQNTMASDDYPGAKEALKSMMNKTGHSGPLPDLIHTMLATDSMEALRRPLFETLSNALIAAVQASPGEFSGDIFLMHCPMVYPDRGADWLQPGDKLLNPYFGAMMLTCGVVKTNLTSTAGDHTNHDH